MTRTYEQRRTWVKAGALDPQEYEKVQTQLRISQQKDQGGMTIPRKGKEKSIGKKRPPCRKEERHLTPNR